MGNLTLKRILKRHKDHPEDEELHKVIESTDVNNEEFEKIVDKASKNPPFDKKK